MKQTLWKGIGVLAICSILTGCGHEHSWTEATCTEPKTCSECGETEGEPLGHTWVEATCAEPKHCSVCGETEGEALEHTLTEANYQQAPTCEVCGQTVGEPLQAEFEQYGCSYVSELDKEYPFINKCYDSDDLTSGKITFSDYKTFVSDDNHEKKEGYEWKTIICTIVFDDDNAFKHGQAGFGHITGDYYDMTTSLNSETDNQNRDIYAVNYNGTEYTECISDYEDLTEEWIEREDGTAYYYRQIQFTFCVPVGYDGAIISVMNDEARQKIMGIGIVTIEDALPYLTDENTVNFRLM